MQHACNTLRNIYSVAIQRIGGDSAPMLAWPLACGSKVAGRTDAIGYADGELAVRVPDTLWRTQLQGFSAQYVSALNQVSPHKVKSIRFVVGR